MRTISKGTQLFKAMKYDEGSIKLWGHACLLNPVIGVLVKNRLMEQLGDSKSMKQINYFAEKFQAFMGVKITGEQFGFAKTYKNKKDLLEFSGGQFELLGYGKVKWVRRDFKNEVFIVRMQSPYAAIYKETLGFSKWPVDYWNAGGWAGCLEYILGKKVACIETACIAQGKGYCEFVIQPIDKWDKKTPLAKKNSFVFKEIAPKLGKVKLAK